MRRIRTRLIVAFLIVAILPAVPLSIVVRNLLERSFGPTMDESLEQALVDGLAESRSRLRTSKESFSRQATSIWSRQTGLGGPLGSDCVWLLAADGRRLSMAVVPPELTSWAEHAETVSIPLTRDDVTRVDEYLAVALTVPDGPTCVLAQRLPAEMVSRAGRLTDALALVRTLRQDRERVLQSYVAPFLLIYSLLILAAIATGALLARRIARPIESLVASTERVAAGDLQTRVTARAAGEVATLVSAFNRMVARLAEQRRQLARLERVAAWRDLARTLAHEIKNPLTPILLAVQSARDSYRGDDTEHRELLQECEQIVSEEVEGLRKLVKEFSEFARLPQPQPTPGDLNQLLRDLGRLYGEEKVHCQLPQGDLPARFDQGELRRALINLIDNGLAACAEAGLPEQVTVTARPQGAGVKISVQDNGTGIAPENLTRVFEPNFSTKKEGMGLGLCIVEGIVTGHGGNITVQSEQDNGTTFTIQLPHLEQESDLAAHTFPEGDSR